MQLNFKVPSACQTVCRKVLTPKEKKHFIKAIDQEYRVHWSVLHAYTCCDMLSLDVSSICMHAVPVCPSSLALHTLDF